MLLCLHKIPFLAIRCSLFANIGSNLIFKILKSNFTISICQRLFTNFAQINECLFLFAPFIVNRKNDYFVSGRKNDLVYFRQFDTYYFSYVIITNKDFLFYSKRYFLKMWFLSPLWKRKCQFS